MDTKDRKTTERPVVFSMPGAECIWSKAGVIESRECINAFDCPGCSIQKSVLPARGEAGETGNRMFVLSKGKCRHMLSGRISYGLCSSDDCARCPVEQMIEDSNHLPSRRRTNRVNVSGFEAARNYYYYRGHTWARIEYGGWVRVGIDDFASRLLGQQDTIVAPELGAMLRQGSPAFLLKRSGREAVISSPVDGVVVAINHKVLDRAFIAGNAPYEDGWIMVIQPTNLLENLKNLLFDADGLSWLDDEAMYLNALLAEESRISLVAVGSKPVRDVFEEAPEIGWDRLVDEFLR